LGYQELHARIREEAILTNLMTKLKQVEENAKTDCKKVMKFLEKFLKTSFDYSKTNLDH
jgi:hypothetical protein